MKKNIAILIREDIEYPKDYRYYSLEDIKELKSEYENIYIGDLIDYLSAEKTKSTIEELVDKLEQNGKIHLKGPDIFQLSWYYSKLNLDISKLRYIIYETGRRTCHTLDEAILLFRNIPGVRIDSASYTNAYEYSITMVKYESN